jgi:hypothetical protein
MFLMAAVVAGIVHNLVNQLMQNLIAQLFAYAIAGDPRFALVDRLFASVYWLNLMLPAWL